MPCIQSLDRLQWGMWQPTLKMSGSFSTEGLESTLIEMLTICRSAPRIKLAQWIG